MIENFITKKKKLLVLVSKTRCFLVIYFICFLKSILKNSHDNFILSSHVINNQKIIHGFRQNFVYDINFKIF